MQFSLIFYSLFFFPETTGSSSMILSGISDGQKMDDRGESVLLPSPVLLIEIKSQQVWFFFFFITSSFSAHPFFFILTSAGICVVVMEEHSGSTRNAGGGIQTNVPVYKPLTSDLWCDWQLLTKWCCNTQPEFQVLASVGRCNSITFNRVISHQPFLAMNERTQDIEVDFKNRWP